ncbi:hypothetical protein N7451_008016 [Penicillium sp. IBT 35674x]|nr:hypothetical protein N7451_008016 [Penicillium sp. IBT 35674x]
MGRLSGVGDASSMRGTRRDWLDLLCLILCFVALYCDIINTWLPYRHQHSARTYGRAAEFISELSAKLCSVVIDDVHDVKVKRRRPADHRRGRVAQLTEDNLGNSIGHQPLVMRMVADKCIEQCAKDNQSTGQLIPPSLNDSAQPPPNDSDKCPRRRGLAVLLDLSSSGLSLGHIPGIGIGKVGDFGTLFLHLRLAFSTGRELDEDFLFIFCIPRGCWIGMVVRRVRDLAEWEDEPSKY